jgi:hypothetical protein
MGVNIFFFYFNFFRGKNSVKITEECMITIPIAGETKTGKSTRKELRKADYVSLVKFHLRLPSFEGDSFKHSRIPHQDCILMPTPTNNLQKLSLNKLDSRKDVKSLNILSIQKVIKF